MVNEVPWLNCEPGRTLGLRLTPEPSARIDFGHRDGHPVLSVFVAERYVDCIVSFFGFQSSPFFHRLRAIEAIFLASVTRARSGLVPLATQAR
jgi:hypothetical protein